MPDYEYTVTVPGKGTITFTAPVVLTDREAYDRAKQEEGIKSGRIATTKTRGFLQGLPDSMPTAAGMAAGLAAAPFTEGASIIPLLAAPAAATGMSVAQDTAKADVPAAEMAERAIIHGGSAALPIAGKMGANAIVKAAANAPATSRWGILARILGGLNQEVGPGASAAPAAETATAESAAPSVEAASGDTIQGVPIDALRKAGIGDAAINATRFGRLSDAERGASAATGIQPTVERAMTGNIKVKPTVEQLAQYQQYLREQARLKAVNELLNSESFRGLPRDPSIQ